MWKIGMTTTATLSSFFNDPLETAVDAAKARKWQIGCHRHALHLHEATTQAVVLAMLAVPGRACSLVPTMWSCRNTLPKRCSSYK